MAQQAGKQSQGLNGMDLIIDGWFHERGELWKGQAMSLEVKKVIHHGRSNFQDLLVFVSRSYFFNFYNRIYIHAQCHNSLSSLLLNPINNMNGYLK